MRRFTALPLLFAPMIAWGDCTKNLQTWAQALHPTLSLASDFAVCKVNPADTSQVLAALPLKVNVDEYGQGDCLERQQASSGTAGVHSVVGFNEYLLRSDLASTQLKVQALFKA